MQFNIVITERTDDDAAGHGCDGCECAQCINQSARPEVDLVPAAMSPLED